MQNYVIINVFYKPSLIENKERKKYIFSMHNVEIQSPYILLNEIR